LTVADDVVNCGQREVLVVEVAVSHATVQSLPIFSQSDKPAIETRVPTPLGSTSPSPAAAGSHQGRRRASRSLHS
jgi:hypothetical protein